MGTSVASSNAETTINTSTESASTLATNVTGTDTSTCDSLDLGKYLVIIRNQNIIHIYSVRIGFHSIFIRTRWYYWPSGTVVKFIWWTSSIDRNTSKCDPEPFGWRGKCANRRVWYGCRHWFWFTSSPTPSRGWRCKNSIVNKSTGKSKKKTISQ